ncbi:divalent-cation tolerance protein CutA [Hyphobacterium sp. HN65]|uniref:Divalent-cation tolerance protein CutA n=1 Tax=Hyphobacterium lacteum TaxID=3116575 RepID=A0ABU7LRF0_9PROT|nr:divalent-cation tolerance protein CutA [Hyphobacterium sp. HN65]MEE2526477.1 divalent-cation tolerance protein CutA [Hyphobacterium sp. HN65]
MSEVSLIYTTWPDMDSARAAAGTLLEEQLIACANLLPGGTSLYRWKGKMQAEPEWVMILKTARGTDCAERVKALHPYEEPAILEWLVEDDGSSAGFLEWIRSETPG